jgi:flagellar biosynthesis GTPase FlhF
MDFLDTSHWVPIHTLPGFQSAIEYYISRDGEVLSTKGNKERILKTSLTADGYEMVRLRKRLGDRGEIGVVVHKLVAFAFLPPPPTPHGRSKGCTLINHIDHDRSNNCLDNLEWATGAENSLDKLNFKDTELGQRPEYQSHLQANREYMREKRLDPNYRAAEREAAKSRYQELKRDDEAYQKMLDQKKAWKKANPEKDKEHQRRCVAKRSNDPERAAKHRAYKRKHREAVKADPEKLKAQREYQREYMRKKRAQQKIAKIEESDT